MGGATIPKCKQCSMDTFINGQLRKPQAAGGAMSTTASSTAGKYDDVYVNLVFTFNHP